MDPSYTTNDITINVIKVEQRTVTQVTRVQARGRRATMCVRAGVGVGVV